MATRYAALAEQYTVVALISRGALIQETFAGVQQETAAEDITKLYRSWDIYLVV